MRGRILGSFVLSLALLGSTFVSAPDAQVAIQRGYGPTITAGSGGATAGISSVLTVSTTSAQTGANTNETDLWTYSLPANTLSADNYGVRVRAWARTAANANSKRLRMYFGGVVVGDTAARATNAGTQWIDMTVFRTGASAQVGSAIWGASGTGMDPNTPASLASDTTAAIVIKVTGTNGSANAADIVFSAAVVEFLRAGS